MVCRALCEKEQKESFENVPISSPLKDSKQQPLSLEERSVSNVFILPVDHVIQLLFTVIYSWSETEGVLGP